MDEVVDDAAQLSAVPVHVEVVLKNFSTVQPGVVMERVEQLLRDQHVEFFDGDLAYDDSFLQEHVERIRVAGIADARNAAIEGADLGEIGEGKDDKTITDATASASAMQPSAVSASVTTAQPASPSAAAISEGAASAANPGMDIGYSRLEGLGVSGCARPAMC